MAGVPPIRIKEVVLVKPAEPTPGHVLQLSTLDCQLFLRFTIEYLLVFHPSRTSSQNAVASTLKRALAKALVPYYPLAGRVRLSPDGSGLEVACEAQGAAFVLASSDHYTRQDFQEAPRHVAEWRHFLSLHVADVLRGAPPVVIQLTWLKDGAAVLGVGISHCLCDGVGSGEFLNKVAESARSHLGQTQPKPNPIWSRHLLNPNKITGTSSLSRHPEFNWVSDVSGSFSSRFAEDELVPTSVTLSKTFLNELKRVEATHFTTFEVLSAHIWTSWVRALRLPPTQETKLLFSVNIRDRLRPSLPAGYYGNAFVLGCAQATVEELEGKGLGFGSTLVKAAKERVDDGHVRSLVELLSRRRASCPDSVGALVMTQWSRLGLDKVDFGMGRAFHVGPVCCDRYCLILPGAADDRSEGGVRVMVAVPASGVARYEYLVKNPFS